MIIDIDTCVAITPGTLSVFVLLFSRSIHGNVSHLVSLLENAFSFDHFHAGSKPLLQALSISSLPKLLQQVTGMAVSVYSATCRCAICKYIVFIQCSVPVCLYMNIY